MDLEDLGSKLEEMHGDLKSHIKQDTAQFEKLDSILFGNGKEGWDTKLYRHESELKTIKRLAWGVVMGVIGSVVWLLRMSI